MIEKPFRVVVDVRTAVDIYYSGFPNQQEARFHNVAEAELESIMLQITDNDYAVGNLKEEYRHVIECNRHNGDAIELRWGRDMLRFGEEVVKILRENRLYNRNGQLIGRFEYLLNDHLLCLYVDEDEEE